MTFAAVAVAVAALCLWSCALAADSDQATSSSVFEDANLNLTGLVTKYGYPIERHTVQTKDGYMLTVYRIPYGRECGADAKRRAPVLLQHGYFSSSTDYLIMGPKMSLGYILADKCYDVWLGNNRGNKESRKHVHLKPEQKAFWAFSWHEMGVYDLPAIIDHILNTTRQPSLHYIGHSQGTTQFFVFGSLRPEYHSKIRSMHALSPVAFMKNAKSPLIRVAHALRDTLLKLADRLNVHELPPGGDLLNKIGSEICKDRYPKLQSFCSTLVSLLCGFDEPQMNKTMLSVIAGHFPAGSGTGSLVHYSQGIASGDFRQFDYGKKTNLIIYKNKRPPKYPIDKITVPVGFYYGQNDFLADLKDVRSTAKLLPNIIEDYLVPYTKFNHYDFLFAIDVKLLLYDRLLEVLEKY